MIDIDSIKYTNKEISCPEIDCSNCPLSYTNFRTLYNIDVKYTGGSSCYARLMAYKKRLSTKLSALLE